MNNRLRNAFIGLVSVVWAINNTAALVIDDFKPPPEVNVVMMGIVGIITASYAKSNKEEKTPDPAPVSKKKRKKQEKLEEEED